MEKINVLDLFCGAGGFSLGLHNAGLRTVAAIELDGFASETFKFNFPKVSLFQKDIKTFTDNEVKRLFKGIDVVVGGPPCQGFSVAGPSQYGKIDKRNNLILETLRFISLIKPAICVVENVKGILSGKLLNKSSATDVFMKRLRELGYNVDVKVLQAADFGVPQWRERVLIVGTRKHRDVIIRPKFGGNRKPWRTVGEAISDLPMIESSQGIEEIIPYDKEALTSYQKLMRENSRGISNHVAMKHTKRLIERFKHIACGQSLVHAPSEHGQRLRNGDAIDAKKRFKMNNQRLLPDKVSLAITASFQSNFIHPYVHRNLTAREGARLQSFPDRFIFKGPRTLMSKTLLKRENRSDEIGLSQYNQIGNAVPPLMAKSIGEAILESLRG